MQYSENAFFKFVDITFEASGILESPIWVIL